MKELLDRIEALTRPDRDVDREIMGINYNWRRRQLCKGAPFRDWCWVDKTSGKWLTTSKQGLEYTSSIDAAMTLATDDNASDVLRDAMDKLAKSYWQGEVWSLSYYRDALPRYICAAALRSRGL